MTSHKTVRAVLYGVGLAVIAVSGASAKTFVYCSEGAPEGFDAALYTASTTFDASSKPIYNRLVEFERGSTQVRPGLAQSWHISQDGLEYTFNLRKGVKFHANSNFAPTRDFNADDVIFSFERQLKKANPWHRYIAGAGWEYFNGMSMPDLLKEIVKLDDYTVKFVLTRPEASMIANLAMDFASIVSAEYAGMLRAGNQMEMMNEAPVGTGPFSFAGYQKEERIRYAAFADYWGGKPPIDTLEFAITPDAAVRLQKLRAGECHLMSNPSHADLEVIRTDGNLKIREQQALNVGYLAYNTRLAPFDRAEVRKALNHAVNKQAIVDTVFQGFGVVAKTPVPPAMWSYNTLVQDDVYDPELAKKMLAEAGITDLSMKIWAMPVERSYNPNARLMAEALQADFAEVGVDVEIVSYTWGEYLSRSKDTRRDGAVLFGWTSVNGDPDTLFTTLLGCDSVGGSNRAQWCDEEFEAVIQKARTASGKQERAALYEEAQTVFKREAPWLTIAHSTLFAPMSAKVFGYEMDAFGGHWFDSVDIRQ